MCERERDAASIFVAAAPIVVVATDVVATPVDAAANDDATDVAAATT